MFLRIAPTRIVNRIPNQSALTQISKGDPIQICPVGDPPAHGDTVYPVTVALSAGEAIQ
jgi:hypothetical protein